MPTEDFHPRRHNPTRDTRDYAFAVLPRGDLPPGVSCAVHIESKDYLAALKETCDRFMLSRMLTTLPDWLTEVSPGRFHSAQSAMFTSMMLKGLQMEESPELFRVVAPEAAAAKRDAWIDPTDQFVHMMGAMDDGEADLDGEPDDESEVEWSLDPRDYLFAVGRNLHLHPSSPEEQTTVFLVERSYFEKEGCISDQCASPDGLPSHLHESMESIFVTERSPAEVRAELEALGMTHSTEFVESLEADDMDVEFVGVSPKRLSDYVYSIDQGDHEPFGQVTTVALVERAFFEENGYLDSVHVSERVKGLPPCMDEVAEATFVSKTPIGELCMLLEAAGVRFHPGFDAFMKGQGPTPSM